MPASCHQDRGFKFNLIVNFFFLFNFLEAFTQWPHWSHLTSSLFEFRPQACQNVKFRENQMTQTPNRICPSWDVVDPLNLSPKWSWFLSAHISGVRFDVHIRIRHYLGSRGPSCGAQGLPLTVNLLFVLYDPLNQLHQISVDQPVNNVWDLLREY